MKDESEEELDKIEISQIEYFNYNQKGYFIYFYKKSNRDKSNYKDKGKVFFQTEEDSDQDEYPIIVISHSIDIDKEDIISEDDIEDFNLISLYEISEDDMEVSMINGGIPDSKKLPVYEVMIEDIIIKIIIDLIYIIIFIKEEIIKEMGLKIKLIIS